MPLSIAQEWKHIDEHSWTRPLWSAERCLDNDSTKGDGLYNITRAISFSTSIPREIVTEELVAQAWIKTRQLKPEVGVRFTPDQVSGANRMQYDVISSEDAERQWLEDTLVYSKSSNWRTLFNRCIGRSLTTGTRGGSALLVFVPGVEYHIAIINISHVINDATGNHALFATFLQSLLDVAYAPQPKHHIWGEEVSRLPQSSQGALEEAMGKATTEQLRLGEEHYKRQLSAFSKRYISFPIRENFRDLPRTTGYAHISLDERETNHLLKKAKSREISLTFVIVAALGVAMEKLFGTKTEEGSVFMFTCDTRRWSNPNERNIAPSMASAINFVWAPKELKTDIGSVATAGAADNVALEVYARHLQGELKAMLNTPKSVWGYSYLTPGYCGALDNVDWNQPRPAGLAVSSLNRIERGLPDKYTSKDGEHTISLAPDGYRVQLRQIDFQPWSHIYTFQGKLTVTLEFCVKYYKPEVMQRVLDSASDILKSYSCRM
ncbi:hypothetical protein PLEOSDRAFT_162806 [Pleurotus ostreatus PC15]|uniref:Condensation domain-containing protein n=1 Tax=Pleurotus ostreatus (strain PC15) TaxID=1137138 RepID=A0A067N865_PLEO1|nr:hypothetical protein PLEOSDRAFT_162806 [Pleurotus ostreatus PC15]